MVYNTEVSYSFLTTPVAGGMVLWEFLVMILLMMVGALAVWTMYQRSKHQKEVKGNLLVAFVPEHGHEYECLCPVINGLEIKPPDGKRYKALTGGERPGDLPGIYFIGPTKTGERSPITTVDYPRGSWRVMQVQVGFVRFREIDSNPLSPWEQEEIVDPIVVAAKTHRALAELILETTKDQLEVFKNIGKTLREIKPPAAWIVYLGLAAAVLMGIVSIVMSQSGHGAINNRLDLLMQHFSIVIGK